MLAAVPMHSLVAVDAISDAILFVRLERSLEAGDTNSKHCFSPDAGRVSWFELHRQGG